MSQLVGREREIGLVEAALAAAGRCEGGALFLVGESGIGKSRLIVEAERRAAGMRILRGRCSAIAAEIPFRALTEALLSLLRAEPAAHAWDLGPYRSVLGRLIPEWRCADSGHDQNSLILLAEGILRLADHAGRDAGCLIVLEDLHDADTETLAVLEYLVDNLDGQPVLLMGSLRPEPPAELQRMITCALQQKRTSLLELGRLDDAQVSQLVACWLEVPLAAVPPALDEQVRAASAGLPLAIEEMLHQLVSAGQLRRGAQGWQLTEDGHAPNPLVWIQNHTRRADRAVPQPRRARSASPSGSNSQVTHLAIAERIPRQLRQRGVTIREYEVYELVLLGLGNKEIGARLHISPRTVEKHVASLLVKTEQTTRRTLIAQAVTRIEGWA